MNFKVKVCSNKMYSPDKKESGSFLMVSYFHILFIVLNNSSSMIIMKTTRRYTRIDKNPILQNSDNVTERNRLK